MVCMTHMLSELLTQVLDYLDLGIGTMTHSAYDFEAETVFPCK